MPPINNFKPKTTSPDAPAPPPINTIPSSEAKVQPSESKNEKIWTPPKPVVKDDPEPEENLTPLEKLHKEAIERAKASGNATDPKSILSIKSNPLQPQLVSPPESHTFAGQMTRQYANIELEPRFPNEVTAPPRKQRNQANPPSIGIDRQWRPPEYQNQVQQEILDNRRKEEEFRKHQEEARYDTHTYVNLNPATRRPELPQNPPSLSG